MNNKELKKLVKDCRTLGILHYKTPELEFTLSAEKPVKVALQAQKQTQNNVQADEIESDTLTPEQLMWWSAVGDGPVPAVEAK